TYGSFNLAGFLAIELMYVILYYVPYEFFFRGFMQFPLVRRGKVKTAWVITYQVIITTAIHWDVPTSELLGAVVLGIIVGILVLRIDSIHYGLIFHIGIGMITNITCLFLLQGWI
ncbi:MAG: CPBP family intramembrane glutamic endopeptidase, partial [Candidatus Hodarchaeota archaeon]